MWRANVYNRKGVKVGTIQNRENISTAGCCPPLVRFGDWSMMLSPRTDGAPASVKKAQHWEVGEDNDVEA